MRDEAIVGRSQFRRGIFAVEHTVNMTARMLYANTDAKAACFERKGVFVQHPKYVSCAVTGGKKKGIGFKIIGFAAATVTNAANRILFYLNVFELSSEQDCSAKCFDLLTYVFYNASQKVGSDMGVCIVQDTFGRTCPDKRFKDLSLFARHRTDLQFSVRKASGTAFAELNVIFLVKRAAVTAAPVKRDGKKTTAARSASVFGKWLVRGVILIVGLLFIVLGILNGGAEDVLGKAVRICTECIGLG